MDEKIVWFIEEGQEIFLLFGDEAAFRQQRLNRQMFNRQNLSVWTPREMNDKLMENRAANQTEWRAVVSFEIVITAPDEVQYADETIEIFLSIVRQLVNMCPHVHTLKFTCRNNWRTNIGPAAFGEACSRWKLNKLHLTANAIEVQLLEPYLRALYDQRDNVYDVQIDTWIATTYDYVYKFKGVEPWAFFQTHKQSAFMKTLMEEKRLLHPALDVISPDEEMLLGFVLLSMNKLHTIRILGGPFMYPPSYIWKYMRTIRTLYLTSITKLLYGIDQLPHVQSVHIDDSHVDEHISSLIKNARIETLSLTDIKHGSDKVISHLSSMPYLRDLTWSDRLPLATPFRPVPGQQVFFPNLQRIQLIGHRMNIETRNVLSNKQLMSQLQELDLPVVDTLQLLIDALQIADQLVRLRVRWYDENRDLWPRLLQMINSKENIQSIRLQMFRNHSMKESDVQQWLVVRDNDGQVVDWITILNRRNIIECDISIIHPNQPHITFDQGYEIQRAKLNRRMIDNQSLLGLKDLLTSYVMCLMAFAKDPLKSICSTMTVENPYLDFFIKHPEYLRNSAKRGILKSWLEKQVRTDEWQAELSKTTIETERQRLERKIESIREWQIKVFGHLLPASPDRRIVQEEKASTYTLSSLSASAASLSASAASLSASAASLSADSTDSARVRVEKRRLETISRKTDQTEQKENQSIVQDEPYTPMMESYDTAFVATPAYAATIASSSSSPSASSQNVRRD